MVPKRLINIVCFGQDPKRRADANTILQHDWMRENGTASERPLDNVILKRMRGFAAMNKLKKEAPQGHCCWHVPRGDCWLAHHVQGA